jgi:hypothetical protein
MCLNIQYDGDFGKFCKFFLATKPGLRWVGHAHAAWRRRLALDRFGRPRHVKSCLRFRINQSVRPARYKVLAGNTPKVSYSSTPRKDVIMGYVSVKLTQV